MAFPSLSLHALTGIPVAGPGDSLPGLVVTGLEHSGLSVEHGDILAVCSTMVSRIEGRFVDLSTIEPSPRARSLAGKVHKDPAIVEVVLAESTAVSRATPGVLITRHHRGFVLANAGVDRSNAVPPGVTSTHENWVLLLPEDPDASARALRADLAERLGVNLGIVITDSFGRPFRLGTTGAAIGVSGLPALVDHRGADDLFGRPLEHSSTALADQIASAAELLTGQAAEGIPAVLVRGLAHRGSPTGSAHDLIRPSEQDLYA